MIVLFGEGSIDVVAEAEVQGQSWRDVPVILKKCARFPRLVVRRVQILVARSRREDPSSIPAAPVRNVQLPSPWLSWMFSAMRRISAEPMRKE